MNDEHNENDHVNSDNFSICNHFFEKIFLCNSKLDKKEISNHLFQIFSYCIKE